MGRYTSGGVGRDVLAGALAGGAAVWLISKMDWSLNHAGAKRRDADGSAVSDTGMDPAHAAAARAARAAGVRIGDARDNPVGHTVHYGVGIGIGALYGLLRGMAPAVTTGRGSLFGVATFILGDEIGAPAMGLAKGPTEYAARDHAKSALAHIVFGIFTDLGTRLLSPWKNEVVIMRGPTIHERIEGGRQAISDQRDHLYDQGREYLNKGRDLASDYAEQAQERLAELDLPGRAKRGRKRAQRYFDEVRSHLPGSDDVADAIGESRKRASRLASDVSSRLPDRDDVADVVERGRKRARSWGRDVADRLPSHDEVEDIVESGRKRARGWASTARSYVPDQDDVSDAAESARTRARGWFRSAGEHLPDRDDVNDAIDEGRRRGRKWMKQARSNLPSRDDVDDAVATGRKRARRVANDAQDRASSGFDRLVHRLFG